MSGSCRTLSWNRTLKAVGSTPIGSTNLFKGLDTVRPLETFPGLPIVRIFVRMFSISSGQRADRHLFLFLLCQISLLALGSFLKVTSLTMLVIVGLIEIVGEDIALVPARAKPG